MPTSSVTPSTPATSSADLIASSHFFTVSRHFLFSSDSLVQLAVEVHLGPNAIEGTDEFLLVAAQLMGSEGQNGVNFLVGGTAMGDPENANSNFSSNLAFDESTNSYYVSATLPAVLTYTLSGSSALWANRYAISCAGNAYSYPTSWILRASNDGVHWIFLDERLAVTFTTTFQRRFFDIPSNPCNYNIYRLEILSKSSEKNLAITTFTAYSTNLPIPLPGIHYPKSTYTFAANVDEVYIQPINTGFTNYTVSPLLPDGILLATSGLFSGISTQAGSFILTVYAVESHTGLPYQTTLTFQIIECILPNYANIRLYKHNGRYAIEESMVLQNEAGDLIYTSPGYANNIDVVVHMCIPTGIYNFTLFDSYGDGWYSTNLLDVDIFDSRTLEYYTLASIRCFGATTSTYLVNIDYIVIPSASGWMYIQGQVPANWYSVNTPSGFLAYPSVPPASTSHLWLFRHAFSYTPDPGYFSLDVRVFCIAGYALYINGEEIYRAFLPDGEISLSTLPTFTESVPVWNEIIVPLSYLSTVGNILAIAIVNPPSTPMSSVVFDASIKYVQTYYGGRGMGLNVTAPLTTSNVASIYDFCKSTIWISVSPNDEPNNVNLDYGLHRAEFFNSYCIMSNKDFAYRDPSDWIVYGSNDGETMTLLGSITNAYWSRRESIRCFYIHFNKPYRYFRFSFIEPAGGHNSSTEYSFSFMFLSTIDYLTTAPEFTLEPNHLVGYYKVGFPNFLVSSDVFSNFRISPPLQLPLELDTSTGSIRGIPDAMMSPTPYTIIASDPMGNDRTFSITMSVVNCPLDHTVFTIYIMGDVSGYQQTVSIYFGNNTKALYTQKGYPSNRLTTVPMCAEPGVYKFVIEDSYYNGWGSGYIAVYDEDHSILLRASLAGTERIRTIYVPIGYVIQAHYDNWKFTNSPSSVPESWRFVLFNDDDWEVSTPGHFGIATSVTSYFRYSFQLEDYERYSAFRVYLYTRYGAVVYLNNKEVYRCNLPNGNINSFTHALIENVNATQYDFVVSTVFSSLVRGLNVMAVELHMGPNYASSEIDFDVKAAVVISDSYRLMDGTASCEGCDSKEVEKMFDNTSHSVFATGPQCVGVAPTYTFNNGRREYITKYSVVTGPRCNARHPSAWRLEASNDGQRWSTLHTVYNMYFTVYNVNTTFAFYNEKAYNSFRLVALECNNQRISHQTASTEVDCELEAGLFGFQLSELALYSSRIQASCYPKDGFGGAIEGEMAYKDCDEYYIGRISASCVDGNYSNITDYCVPGPVYSISYGSDTLVVYNGFPFSFTPIVEGVGYECSYEGVLFQGMSFDNETGTISGTVTSVFSAIQLTVSCSTKKYPTPATAVVYISSVEKFLLPIYIWIIIFVLVVMIFMVVVLVVVFRRKSRKHGKKLQLKRIPGKRTSKSVKSLKV